MDIEYVFIRYNGKIEKYEKRDNFLINVKNAFTIDLNKVLPLGRMSERLVDLIEFGDIIKVYSPLLDLESNTIIMEHKDETYKILEEIKKGKIEIVNILTHEQFEENSFEM